MKNKIIYILIIITTFVLIVSLGIGFYLSYEISKTSNELGRSNDSTIYKHHVMVILDESNQAYSEAFEKGMRETADTLEIAIEIIKINGDRYIQEVVDRMDMAMYAKVDGIILHAYNNDLIIEKIDQARNMDISVITLNEDLPQSSRDIYVGVNRYYMGTAVGKAIAQGTNGIGKVAIVEGKAYESSMDKTSEDVSDLLLLGIQNVFQNYIDLDIELVKYTEEGVLSAESIALDIIKNEKDIDAIFCTNGPNTLGMVQVIIDQNKVNDFTLIGFGDDDEILSYIEKGKIIYATIVIPNEGIGRNAIQAFSDLKNKKIVTSHMDADIKVINNQNIEAYREDIGDEHD